MVTPNRPEATCLIALRRQIAVRVRIEALFVLAAFAGVGSSADAVHRDGQRLVRFLADGAVRHGAGGEALARSRLPARPLRSEPAWLAGLNSISPRKRAELAALIVDQRRCTP